MEEKSVIIQQLEVLGDLALRNRATEVQLQCVPGVQIMLLLAILQQN